MQPLTNLSPLDGRYQEEVNELADYFSEAALIKYRGEIEKKYLIALLKILKKGSSADINKISKIIIEPDKIKKIEKITNHDVKAVEYYLREKLKKQGIQNAILELIHFALTSEDINNLAYSLMLQEGLKKIYLPHLNQLIQALTKLARQHKNTAILGLTHGQPATPTTLGKELAVFIARLKRQTNFPKLLGKLSGATGNWAAHYTAYPKINWPQFSKTFINSLGLEFNPLTTQIEPHDSLAETYQQISRLNNILKNFCQDAWLYISRGIFKQKIKKGEIGSSTMPHKINPIYFENAEGNLGLSTAILDFMANKLTISRLQRDLSDSTTLRNQGVALGYGLLAIKNIIKGLSRLEIDKIKIEQELDNNWEVLAEPIQTVLRKLGYNQGYEKLKQLTRGKKLNQELLHQFIDNLIIPEKEKQKLKQLTPHNYTGISAKLLEYIG